MGDIKLQFFQFLFTLWGKRFGRPGIRLLKVGNLGKANSNLEPGRKRKVNLRQPGIFILEGNFNSFKLFFLGLFQPFGRLKGGVGQLLGRN